MSIMQTNNGIVLMAVNQMSSTLANAYASLLKANVSLWKFPSVMLWGAPVRKNEAHLGVQKRR